MQDANKIGLGIITCERQLGLKRALTSLPWDRLDRLVIVNDGAPLPPEILREVGLSKAELLQNKTNLGVGKSKNRAFRHLLEAGMDHLFLMEDDIFVKDPSVFDRYIEAARYTGIQHLNFSQHGPKNRDAKGKADFVSTIDYGSLRIALYRHCVGAFSYYSSKCLQEVGLMDEEFYNSGEHLEHTYRILQAGFHPPFWFFADLDGSADLLGEEPWSPTQSLITSRSDPQELIRRSDALFSASHGRPVGRISVTRKGKVLRSLQQIRRRFGAPGGGPIRATEPWRPQPSRRNLWDKLRGRLSKAWSATSG